MTSTPDSDTTRDAFLGGRVWLHQPRRGYRAGVDPVLLAASVAARPGMRVLDMGCGAGAALLCLGARVAGLELHGLEVQPAYAALARRSAEDSGVPATVHEGDIARMPKALRALRFHRVLTNPPYYDRGRGTASPAPARETALGEALPLEDWIATGARRLEPRGVMSVIQKADRLPALLAAMDAALGALRVRPVASRAGRDASLVVVEGTKGGRAPARLEAPFVLHEGSEHVRDGDGHSPAAQAILRYGEAWA